MIQIAGERAHAPMLSLVIPAYNEEARLAPSLAKMRDYLESCGFSHEIVVVDDGSTDGTAKLVEEAALGDGAIRLLKHESNLGKGQAVRTGMLAARGDIIIFSDADLSTPIETTGAFVSILSNGGDVVVGNRRMAQSRLEVRQPWIREFLGRIFTRMTRFMLRSQVSDQTCGFKGFKKQAAQEVFSRQTISDWAFDAEILHIAAKRGLRIKQLPVSWHDESGTKVRVLSAGVRSLVSLVRILHNSARGRYN